MNLERLLAENMVRFGTRNLNELMRRTLLNEGLRPGDEVGGEATNLSKFVQPIANISENNPTVGNWLTQYSSIRFIGSENEILSDVAMAALAVAVFQEVQKNQKAKKNITNPYICLELIQSPNSMPSIDDSIKTLVSETASNIVQRIQYAPKMIPIIVFQDAANAFRIPTSGLVAGQGVYSISDITKRSNSRYDAVSGYASHFNLQNVTGNASDPGLDFKQYDLSNMPDNTYGPGVLDLTITATFPRTLIVYTKSERTKPISDVDKPAASEPDTRDYDISFERAESTVSPNDPEVTRAINDAIKMFPDGNITNLKIVSSASPEFNSEQGGPKTLADYGQTQTTGTGDPGRGTDFISRNIKLAYDRGVNFVNAINAGLEAQGRSAIQNPTIQWQISDKGGKKVLGRFSQIQWATAGPKGTPNVTRTAGTTTEFKKQGEILQHIWKW